MRIISGKFGRRRFDVPTNITARPTTDFARENIFNVISNIIDFDDAPSALDLFSGTGAVTFEFLSRGCSRVTAVEKAATQYNFIRRVASTLGVDNLTLLRTDALRFIQAANQPYDIVFADPPYDLPGFENIPTAILNSPLVAPGTLFIIEHSKKHDFSTLPHFIDHRTYGSVNFSLFQI
jgi:16S rRNA (guanine(966)-N(2))-methyltransferase RsmD